MPQRLRACALHLFASAIKAREDGDVDYSDKLVGRAGQYLDEASTLEGTIRQQQQQLPKK